MRAEERSDAEDDVGSSVGGGVVGPVLEECSGEEVVIPGTGELVIADLSWKLADGLVVLSLNDGCDGPGVCIGVGESVAAEDGDEEHRGHSELEKAGACEDGGRLVER